MKYMIKLSPPGGIKIRTKEDNECRWELVTVKEKIYRWSGIRASFIPHDTSGRIIEDYDLFD
jgi:hypothetical protein